MIRGLLRQISVTYAVGACLLRLVELVDEALAPPASASLPGSPPPAEPLCPWCGTTAAEHFCHCEAAPPAPIVIDQPRGG